MTLGGMTSVGERDEKKSQHINLSHHRPTDPVCLPFPPVLIPSRLAAGTQGMEDTLRPPSRTWGSCLTGHEDPSMGL